MSRKCELHAADSRKNKEKVGSGRAAIYMGESKEGKSGCKSINRRVLPQIVFLVFIVPIRRLDQGQCDNTMNGQGDLCLVAFCGVAKSRNEFEKV